MVADVRLLNSITDADATLGGAVVLTGSHGGLYPAAVASHAGLRAAIFNDAGIGLDEAGLAGVKALAGVSMAGAAVDCMSACIGSADDMMENGVISFANDVAADLGVAPGMTVADAIERLHLAKIPTRHLPKQQEARTETCLAASEEMILLVDSASLVQPADQGRIIITGSHGGLIGGDPSRALKAKARLAVFNDAGFGKNRIGCSRLPALDDLGVAGVTVSHETAKIGDAGSTLATGVVSAANEEATALGIECGEPLKTCLQSIIAR
jgi:uncharacterized protein YunC (DUF1805 family)